MTDQAPHRAFLVPEILEAILLQLPLRTLLVAAQLVSRQWKTAIDTSVSVQQALFFEPLPADPSIHSFHLNSLLQESFPPWFRTNSRGCNGKMAQESLPWAADPESRAAAMRSDASWRRMLPCQPARKVLKVRGKKNIKEGFFEISGRAVFEDGVRMGQLYDFGIDVLRKHVGSLWIPWDEMTGEYGDEERQLTIYTEHSWFKAGTDLPPDIGDEFLSEAYQEVKVDLRQEERARSWHGGFGRPPNGGWQLP